MAATPWLGSNVVIGAQQVFMSDGLKPVGLDPRTGRELRKVALPLPSAYQSWSAAGADTGGKPIALVNGGGDGPRTNRLAALGAARPAASCGRGLIRKDG